MNRLIAVYMLSANHAAVGRRHAPEPEVPATADAEGVELSGHGAAAEATAPKRE